MLERANLPAEGQTSTPSARRLTAALVEVDPDNGTLFHRRARARRVGQVSNMESMQVEFGPTGLLEVLDALREGIQVLDFDFRYVYVNEAVLSHGKRERSELLGRTMEECYPGIEQTETFAFLKTCMVERKLAAKRNEFTYPDGTKRVFELRVQPCSAGVVVLSIDVTEETRLSNQLAQAQKMDALGRLAGGVAHDFNNLLTIILSGAELARERLDDKEIVRGELESIIESAQKASHLTGQLLAFSRGRDPKIEPLNINLCVQQFEPILQRILGRAVKSEIDLASDLALVRMDSANVDQILLNLTVNARDAMDSGGILRIETRNVFVSEVEDGRPPALPFGHYVMLAITDTGSGIPTELRARIFEPFFTTKADRGTGLGLSIIFNIVQRAGGGIELLSEIGKGTSFRIYLPVDRAPAVQPAAELGGA